MINGWDTKAIHPAASGSPDGVKPKQTDLARASQSEASGFTGQKASAHHAVVIKNNPAAAVVAAAALVCRANQLTDQPETGKEFPVDEIISNERQ
jgi:hypothetical protein